MDRTEKIIKLQNLDEAIKQKTEKIIKEESELKKLKEQYAMESISELPVLLFMFDHTLPMPENDHDWEYQYIYYSPDLDSIKCVVHHRKNEFLPNIVDLREQFEYLGIPSKSWPTNAYHDHFSIIMQAISVLKSQIDKLFNFNDINSWAELGNILSNGTLENGCSMVLKPSNSQK